MTRFRQALLDELLTRVVDPVDQPAPASRGVLRRRPRLVLAAGGGFAVLAVAATLVLTTAQAPTAAAYVLTANKDGTVTVRFHHIADPDGVNRALREAGVRAAVFPPQPAASCPVSDRGTEVHVGIAQAYAVNTALVWDTDVAHLRPDQIPAGTVLALIPRSHGPRGEAGLYLYSSLYRDPGPKCVADDVRSGPISPAPAGPVASAPAAGDSTGIPDSPGPGGSPR
ncbi:hypothetical protein [Micromonospora rubida]|uniref:hypothetical protein n=1 Tax=Micromonospora rubida TaxID=2697657 RepID=UPI001376F0CF|nr:hypothetical protein [Micromonospora rubida]NBE85193.1 hypothetical protein [Micromonospora rubida]